MWEEVHFSKFGGLQAYSRQLYYQINSFTGIFQWYFKLLSCSLMFWLKSPPSNFEDPSPPPPSMFATPVGNPGVHSPQLLWVALLIDYKTTKMRFQKTFLACCITICAKTSLSGFMSQVIISYLAIRKASPNNFYRNIF